MRYLKKWSNQKALLVLSMVGLCMLGIGFVMENEGVAENVKENELVQEDVFKITDADRQDVYANATLIDLSKEKSDVVITEAGAYKLSGRINGSVIIEAEEQIVHLVLSNAEILAVTGPAIMIKSAGKVIITLAEQSENILKDSADYRGYEGCDAAVYSSCDMTFNGSGAVYIYGYYKDAIHTKDVLKILGGNFYVKAKRDGIRANDGMLLQVNLLVAECEKNGIHSTNVSKNEKGMIDIDGGEIQITAGEYAICSANDLYIRRGELFLQSVIDNLSVEGRHYIAEGCILNE